MGRDLISAETDLFLAIKESILESKEWFLAIKESLSAISELLLAIKELILASIGSDFAEEELISSVGLEVLSLSELASRCSVSKTAGGAEDMINKYG